METYVDIYIIGSKGGGYRHNDNVCTYVNTNISGNWIKNAAIVTRDGVSDEFLGNHFFLLISAALFGYLGVR